MVSLKNKLLAFKKECFKELFNKETELKNIEKDINYTIEQARKEIFSESQRIDSRINMLKIEEKRILNLRSKVEQEIDVKKQWLESRISKHIDDVIGYFQELLNYGKQQKIIDAYINACYALDEKLSKYFENKQRPAINTAEIVRAYKKENSEYLHRIKELEYQISELWAKDVDGVVKESFEFSDDEEERVRYFLSPREYKSLSPSERNQRALDNYL